MTLTNIEQAIHWFESGYFPQIFHALGHFLWQGCVIAMLYAAIACFLRRFSANTPKVRLMRFGMVTLTTFTSLAIAIAAVFFSGAVSQSKLLAKTDAPAEEPKAPEVPTAPPKNLAELIEQVRRNEALYQNLDYTVHTTVQYNTFDDGIMMEMPIEQVDLKRPRSLKTIEEIYRIVVQGDLLYFSGEETISSRSDKKRTTKRLSVCDGLQTVSIDEGNSATVHPGRFEPYQVIPPHCLGLFHLDVNIPLSSYLQGSKAKLDNKLYKAIRQKGDKDMQIEAELIGGEMLRGIDCVKIRVKCRRSMDTEPAIHMLWLSKKRNLHVVECRNSFMEKGKESPRAITRVTKWQELSKGVWLPEVVEWQDISPSSPPDPLYQKEAKSLVVKNAVWKPNLPGGFFALPRIPTTLPLFVIGEHGQLTDSPHHPVPIKARDGTTLETILKRLAEQEKRYEQLEVDITSTYRMCNLQETLDGSYLSSETIERSILSGKNVFHEEKLEAKLNVGKTTSHRTLQAFDGQWSRQRFEHFDAQGNPQVTAELKLGMADQMGAIWAHTLLLHDDYRTNEPLSGFLVSGWFDKLNKYPMTVEYIGDEVIDRHLCHKLKCMVPRKNHSGPSPYIFLWLASDRNLLPIRFEWREPSFSEMLPTGIKFVNFFKEIQPGLWFPIRTTNLAYKKWLDGRRTLQGELQWRRDMQVNKITLNPQFEEKLFNSVEVPEGATVYVRDDLGDNIGQFKQPKTGNIAMSLEELHAMQKEAEASN